MFNKGREGKSGFMVNIAITGFAALGKVKGTTRYTTTTGVFYNNIEHGAFEKFILSDYRLTNIEAKIKSLISDAIRFKQIQNISRDAIREIINIEVDNDAGKVAKVATIEDKRQIKGKHGEFYQIDDTLKNCIQLYIDTKGGHLIGVNKNEVKYGTLKEFNSLIAHVEKIKKGAKLSDIDQDFLNQLEKYFKNSAKSTFIKNTKMLKRVLKFANEKKVDLLNNEFYKEILIDSSQITNVQTENIFALSFEELQELYKFNNFEQIKHPERSEIARDLFIFQCMTGIRVSDLHNFKRFTIDGIDSIHFVTQKTDVISAIPLNKTAQAIINKYADMPFKGSSSAILPLIPEQHINISIKLVGSALNWNNEIPIYTLKTKDSKTKIDTTVKYKMLKTKVGRKTFATLLDEQGFESAAKQMMGYGPTGIYHRHYAKKLKLSVLLNAVRTLELN